MLMLFILSDGNFKGILSILVGLQKRVNLVLVTFSESLLALNHSSIWVSSS